jgi:hypothetical protein
MKKLNKIEMENYRHYHIPGCGNLNTLKLDAVFFNAHNTKAHEMKKAEICFELLQLGKHFLTEAEKNKCKGEPTRRVDVVDLSSGDEIEIETNHSIKKEGAITIYI